MKSTNFELIDINPCTSTKTEVNDLCNKCKDEMKEEINAWKEAQ